MNHILEQISNTRNTQILDSDLAYFIEVEFCFSIYTIIKQYHIYATEDHIVPVGKRL